MKFSELTSLLNNNNNTKICVEKKIKTPPKREVLFLCNFLSLSG